MTSGTARTPRKATETRAAGKAATGPDGSQDRPPPDDGDEVAKLKAKVAELERRLKTVERQLEASRRENQQLRDERKELEQRENQEDELQRILTVTDEGERARRLAQLSSEERKLYVKLRMESR
ncbi:hypothetical protein P8605_30285 [Streptomyces sp. T-3]|nr:hypothetical protein [Streptomyces sp. T-3]